ncbi:MAG: hypothetical protein C5B54_09175 [Acidobacteria bacterium]|nr:MAG: hypothetical protein C5B54_09175 [Acidobacteriota bacterium]
MSSKGNGYNPKLLETLLRTIDGADDQLASYQGEYMQNCKGPRETIAAVFEQAKDAGIPKRAFKTLVKNRRLDRQMNANVAKLEPDSLAEYEKMVSDLGDFCDLPLGQAAVSRAAAKLKAAGATVEVRTAEASLDSLTQ